MLKRHHDAVPVLVISETPGGTVPFADTVGTIARFAAPARVFGLTRVADAEAADHIFNLLVGMLSPP